MKLKSKNILKHQQILKLQLIKSRIYELNTKNNNRFNDIRLNQIITNVKKALKIIFTYNSSGKKIIFLGINDNLLVKKINIKTNHVALPLGFKTQGLFSANVSGNLRNKYLISKLKTKPNLIIIFNNNENNDSILKESYLLKIPSIVIGTSVAKKTEKNQKLSFFNVEGNLIFIKSHHFFYKYLKFLFKKQYLINTQIKKNENKKKI